MSDSSDFDLPFDPDLPKTCSVTDLIEWFDGVAPGAPAHVLVDLAIAVRHLQEHLIRESFHYCSCTGRDLGGILARVLDSKTSDHRG